MITIFTENCNHFSQESYDSVMSRVPIHRLTCSACGRSGCLQYHGSYRRKVRSSQGTVVLRIQRVKCTECGRTHALLLSSLVPYSQIAAETQRQIAETFETKGDRSSFCTPEGAVDENDVKAVIMRYRLPLLLKLQNQPRARGLQCARGGVPSPTAQRLQQSKSRACTAK